MTAITEVVEPDDFSDTTKRIDEFNDKNKIVLKT